MWRLLIVPAALIATMGLMCLGTCPSLEPHAMTFGSVALAEDEAPAAADATPAPKFIGAKKCGACHKKEAKGGQYLLWQEMAHAKAYETLASEQSLTIAKELGIEDPQQAPQCLACHATAAAVLETIGTEKITLAEGVSCESCHGAGGEYWKKKTMKAIFDGTMDAAELGLVKPTEAVCVGCHNEDSPTFDGFNFEEMSAKIAHPYPEGMREASK